MTPAQSQRHRVSQTANERKELHRFRRFLLFCILPLYALAVYAEPNASGRIENGPQAWVTDTEEGHPPKLSLGQINAKLFGVAKGCDGPIRAFADAGNGLIHLGGTFGVCEETAARNVVSYDTRSKRFIALGAADANGVNGPVYALTMWEGGLVVGGRFDQAAGQTANNVALWAGTRWQSFGSGAANGVAANITPPSGTVTAATVYAVHAKGTDLYVAGSFLNAGGARANSIARWNGTQWQALIDQGQVGVSGTVYALTSDLRDVYVGGSLTAGGEEGGGTVVRWTGTGWRGLGGTFNDITGRVNSLVFDGRNLYAGGDVRVSSNQGTAANRVAHWNGSTWTTVGGNLNGGVASVVIHAGALHAGGSFSRAGGLLVNGVARLQNGAWTALAVGGRVGVEINDNSFPAGSVSALQSSASGLYAGGFFSIAGGITATGIANWSGSAWRSLGTGIGNGVNGPVYAIAVTDELVYVGGNFTEAGGAPARNIAAWNGSRWISLENGTNGPVYALLAAGDQLYATGYFNLAGSTTAYSVARWDGEDWSPLGRGLGNGRGHALAIFNGEVFVGGYADFPGIEKTFPSFANAAFATTPDGLVFAGEIYRWNGNELEPFRDGFGLQVWDGNQFRSIASGREEAIALAHSNGRLYVGGSFTTYAGSEAKGVAVWDGQVWRGLGIGAENGVNGAVYDIRLIDTQVFVAGSFTRAGTVPANGLARWDGTHWFGYNVEEGPQVVYSLAASASVLYAGGRGLSETPLPDLLSSPGGGTVGNGASQGAAVARNAGAAAFISAANNFGVADADTLPDVYLRVLGSGTIIRASAAAEQIGPASESFDDPSISADGSTVAFTGSSGEIYLVQGGVGRRINVNTGGALGNGAGKDPVIRGPGPGDKVYFASDASNITGNDSNGFSDIFVRNLSSGQLQRLSDGAGGVPSNGPSSKPDASDDGFVVAFMTRATNIVPTGAVPNTDQIVAVVGSTKSYISRNVNTGQTGNANSRNVRITPDGRFGVFESDASNLVANDTNGVTDIFWFERVNGQVARLERVSVSRFGIQANGPSRNPSISDDGQYVTFETDATNLIELDRNGVTDILVRWMVTGEVLRLSRTVDGEQPNGHSTRPMISGDGSTIVFGSDARNLTANDTNNARDVFSVRLREPAPAVVVTGPQDEPSLTAYALPTPNPANPSCPAGFFIASVDDGPGSGLTPGIFGVELLLDAPGTRLLDGGLNFGGLIDAGQVGFAGFNFTNPANELQRVTLSLTGNPASGTTGSLPVRVSVIRQSTAGNTTVFDTTRTINLTTPFVTSIDLTPGFYVATVAATGGTVGGAAEGQFFLGMQTSFVNRPGGGFQGGAVVGGYHAQNPAGGPSGFAGFCLGTQHSTSIRVLSRPTYGETGAKDLRLRLQDAQQRVLVDVPAG